jgi:hypothetical protein
LGDPDISRPVDKKIFKYPLLMTDIRVILSLQRCTVQSVCEPQKIHSNEF